MQKRPSSYLLAAVGSLLLVFLVLSAALHFQRRADLREELQANARTFGRTVVEALEAEARGGASTAETLQAVCESLAGLPNLLWMEIFDDKATVVAHTDPRRIGHRPLKAHNRHVEWILAGESAIGEWDHENDRFDHFIELPVRTAGGDSNRFVLGLVFDTRYIGEALLADWRRQGLLLLAAALASTTTTGFILNRMKRSDEARDTAERAAARLGAMIEEALHEVYVFDAESLRFKVVNAGARRNLGYRMDELEGLTPLDLKPSYTREEFEALLAPLRDGRRQRVQFSVEHRRKDGSTYPVQVNLSLSRSGDGPLFIAMITDQTEALRQERALRQAQKMEAIGQLSAGVAHDFNNLLTTIQGCADLIRSVELSTESSAELRQIDDAVERAAALTQKLLTFGRRQPNDPVPLDLKAEIGAMMPLLRRTIREDISVETHLCPEPAIVLLDPVNLEQVLMNLVVNARDAMEDGGRLDISLTVEPGDPRSVAVLSLSDTGTGIPEGVQEHVFEPFFSTKATEQGSGLGLSTVHGIVSQAGGEIALSSRVGEGTTITLRLPTIEGVAETRAASERP